MKIMRRETPEVIVGARGPREQREIAASEQKAKRSSGWQTAPAGLIRFQSAYANLRIQLTAPPDVRDPFTGRLTPGRPKAAQFRDHFYDVKEGATDILGWMKEHPAYGKSFWLLADVVAEARRQQVEEAKKVLMDPEQREAVLEALKESNVTDFVLPPIEANE